MKNMFPLKCKVFCFFLFNETEVGSDALVSNIHEKDLCSRTADDFRLQVTVRKTSVIEFFEFVILAKSSKSYYIP